MGLWAMSDDVKEYNQGKDKVYTYSEKWTVGWFNLIEDQGSGKESAPTSRLLTECQYNVVRGSFERLVVLVSRSGTPMGLKKGWEEGCVLVRGFNTVDRGAFRSRPEAIRE
ncbi:hypothetical protein P167DRAFT_577083 [Morchella conica CCBAS932]|uniref:Uncharacterized protein n=1 Tax=Morchella conica CCBAS932 TaxID=1392247 RepID=A0A3N4KGG9_9PEZI|nr:hypothetical protein P167DRAFT_577083 [Morchella conica CCBAS932]